ncbi:MAG: phosphoribosylamine--glycine ligase, partial [Desulfovibrio sp.]|nr:phosphoribosylamine--glycine ligase [Desulfovibrio sp.]
MQVLIVGSGGREHALAYKVLQSAAHPTVYVAPGNGGTFLDGCYNVPIKADDVSGLVQFAQEKKIDLVIVGPELPLTLGLTDALQSKNIPCFGPTSFAAKLEGSKSFAKQIMHKAAVPTAQAHVVTSFEEAKIVLQRVGVPCVLKADGLAAGKGVVICTDFSQAQATLHEMLNCHKFGQASASVLIEEYLEGEEVSLLCFCDGEHALPLPSAQDHKRAYDQDQGPNTGGMGAYCPAPVLPSRDLEEMADKTIRPILRIMAQEGHPFVGVL